MEQADNLQGSQLRQRLDDADSVPIQMQLFERNQFLQRANVLDLIERQVQLKNGRAFGDSVQILNQIVGGV